MNSRLLSLLLVFSLVLVFCSCEGDGDSLLFQNNFDNNTVGMYSVNALNAGWGSPNWNRGVSEGRVAIISGADAYSGESLRVSYPVGAVGMGAGGAGWRTQIAPHDIIYLSYRIKFKNGYDFVRGGKLPGLGGGRANTGGGRPTGDGWSVRFMWRDSGTMSTYVYHMDQPRNYGEHFDASVKFSPGKWHLVKMRIKMNTPGIRDGSLAGWLDGKQVIEVGGLRFRSNSSTKIDKILFETFFGGSGASYAPTRNEYVDFDDFMVWQ